MVSGWRRAFCTFIPKEQRETALFGENQSINDKKTKTKSKSSDVNTHSPRIIRGFFSNPSTPSLRCQTTTTPNSVPNSPPKLHCKTSHSPRLFHFSNPSSPRSPSTFSFLKALSKSTSTRCGVCSQSVKRGQATAIFTAECNHVFHFHCVAAQQHLIICPVCSVTWKHMPMFSGHRDEPKEIRKQESKLKDVIAKSLRVYNDDEPLMSPSHGSLFNPIPELEENESDVVEVEHQSEAFRFKGFFVSPTPRKAVAKNVEVSLLPESAIVAIGRNHQTHAVVLKVRAPPAPTTLRRTPVDLVTVLDVSERMCGFKSQMMKRAMRLVISTLSSNDRLSIVAFSSGSKRLLPLRRMTANGRRAARRIVEALGTTGLGMSVNDALKKAAKVIEDRREKNPISTIMIFSNGHDERSTNQNRSSMFVSSTRFTPMEIPTHSIVFGDSHAPSEDALVKCIRGLLSVVVQDLKLQLGFAPGSGAVDIPAVYSLTGRPSVLDHGSVRVGDLHAEEERELLVELKVTASSCGSQQVLSVRSSFTDPSSQEQIWSRELSLLVPYAQPVRSSTPIIQRLRNLHVSTRAIAETRRLMEQGDYSGAYQLLLSARALMVKSGDASWATDYLRGLEAEVQRRRQRSGQQVEPLTPTSGWRAAERLAKVAIMRKHMNRVSDLHGFENARF
ncbi:hypothetical protein K2173_002530 [Erythroxylum novogranatense]|uniref:Zinc finger family protein n=1 Tax=Erythroxylum novogranatense TaxID=1862640 RepID=A0AAV8TQW5_9ROSI|nr:hypothetical protein K2173_002530 [Erythroxylum novogranatense]